MLTYISVLILCLYYLSITIVATPIGLITGSGPGIDRSPDDHRHLVLRSENFPGLDTDGMLNGKIESETYENVYNLESGWRWGANGHEESALAASFDPQDGEQEVQKLRGDNKLVDWGYDRWNRGGPLWIIFKK